MEPTMRRILVLASCLPMLALGLNCGGTRYRTVSVPPRIDLAQHELIGVVQFDAEDGEELAPLATRRFTEAARRDQGLVRMVDLGPSDEVLNSVGRDHWDTESYRALGQSRGVRTLLVGELTIGDVKPDVRIDAALRGGTITAQVKATLAVRMIETESGASIWSRSAWATRTVGQVSLARGGRVAFAADDLERAYGDLIDALVAEVAPDFQVGWQRVAVP
jgi:hypothetical protein